MGGAQGIPCTETRFLVYTWAMDETEKRGRGRPRLADPRDPHTHRYARSTYTRAEAIAGARGEDLADVLGRALANYVKRHGSAPTD